MVKDVKSMQNLGEVAPALLISHQKPSSSPRLETIAEEDCGGVRVPKRVFILLPVLLSLSFYVLLYRNRYRFKSILLTTKMNK
ncbi:Uncharacterized protein TCM_029430 [Theobroma cacao]|uniref:Uncharacterized protein n=1 Tax=Theobroma cacao TaxID=3641 RepID=A0A061GKM8_THECC|nr:Uncharacterized protein TCM_029430 [Theobroma cacao]